MTYSSLFSLVRGSPAVQWCYANLLHRQIIRARYLSINPATVVSKTPVKVHKQSSQSPPKSIVHFNETSSLKTSEKILGRRNRCERLSSLHDEYFIVSMINVLISQGKVEHAEPLFNIYRREGHQFDVEVYNQLLFGWAEQGNHLKTTILYRTMLHDGIVPNHHTYAALLYLYSKNDDNVQVRKLIKDMKKQGYVVSHLLRQVKLPNNQISSLVKLFKKLKIKSTLPPKQKVQYPSLVLSAYNTEQSSTNIVLSSQISTLFDSQTFQNRIQSQLEVELRGYETIKSVARPLFDENKPCKVSDMLNKLYSKWEKQLAAAIGSELEDYDACLQTMEESWYSLHFLPKHLPFLATLTSKQWTQIIMDEMIAKLVVQPDGQPVFYLCKTILGPAWRKYVIAQKKERGITDKVDFLYRDYIKFILSPQDHTHLNSREFWNQLQNKDFENGTPECNIPSWPYTVGIYIGSTLVDILLQTLKLPNNIKDLNNDEFNDDIPAFEHVYEFRDDKKTGFVRPHPSLYSLVKQLHSKAEAMSFKMESSELPMLVPPRPWSSVTEGGYLVTPSSIVRCYDDTYQHQLLLEATDTMTPVLDSLNYLGSCPWTVNTRILDLIIDVFNKGGNETLDIPSSDMPEIPDFPSECDEETRQEITKKRKEVKKIHNEAFSLRMDMLYKLSMSHHYRDTIFWLPHNMDFRSRVYPIPPHITHLSSDVGRALIQFGVGYPLGKRGLEWLKIHLANLHGAKSKASLSERIKFTEEMLPEIFDSSDKPFEGNLWWQDADEPWQTLACCMELTNALRSNDPENFISHIPVHQDGSCNGLQHYAALGRDLYGARQVNLVPAEKPFDLYSGVASLVDKMRSQAAKEGHEVAQLLEGKVSRKVVKQTVMTVVYGVTWVGGRQQIEKQLKGNIPDDALYKSSSYLVDLVFSSLREMFSNARMIQDWLTSSGRMIALAGHPVEWVTPLGMPVVQPYHKSISKELKTRLQSIQRTNSADFTRPPNPAKQKSAMPPNFVHSLDSTHMMLTALHCQRSGVPFVAVHDSYWTHSAFVDQMNKICREQFVALHSEPILEDLAAFFEKKFGGLPFYDGGSKWTKGKPGKKNCSFKEDLPSRGDLQLNCVNESIYFFS